MKVEWRWNKIEMFYVEVNQNDMEMFLVPCG